MAQEIPVEKKFSVLCQISRAQHFAWRNAVAEMCPGAKTEEVVNKMWAITGIETGKSYLKRMDPKRPLPIQIAKSIVWSSNCMGEDAEVVEGKNESEAFVRHNGCPWFEWHKQLSLLPEDRPGCDTWFGALIQVINRKMNTKIKFETIEALPDGGDCCLRRIHI